ncbi:MAG: ABC transporter permease subunit [Alphaproteobacteria bacterium]|jgi:sodium transport system permease protein|nr:ABC transporter permease subunit [Alphaproteobacteria bacterium]
MTPARHWQQVCIVFGKEMRDHLRDWRSLLLALVYPLLGPLLIGALLALSAGTVTSVQRDRPIDLAVSGAENDPALVSFLEERGVFVRPAPPDPEDAVRRGREPVVLAIPAEASEARFYGVRILFDGGRVSNRLSAAALADLIATYGRRTARPLLADAGLDPRILQPVSVVRQDLGTPTHSAAILYGMIGPLTVFIIFLGSVYVCIDSIAGERERGSLEPLLMAPVARWVLLLGKGGAGMCFIALSTAVSLAAFKGLAELAVAGIDPPPPSLAVFTALFVLSVPLMLVAVTLQMLIAVLSRSMKEAQIYLGLLPLVPAMPGILLVFTPVELGLWSAAVPVLGHLVVFTQLLAGNAIPWATVGLSAAVCLLAALLLFQLATRLFQREAVFGVA